MDAIGFAMDEGIDVSTNSVIMKHTYRGFPGLVERLARMGVRRISLRDA